MNGSCCSLHCLHKCNQIPLNELPSQVSNRIKEMQRMISKGAVEEEEKKEEETPKSKVLLLLYVTFAVCHLCSVLHVYQTPHPVLLSEE